MKDVNEIAIRCKGIKKFYGEEGEARIEALRGIDLDIYKNQLTLLVGPSGSGKTTLLSIISTLLTPEEGILFLLGKEISSLNVDQKTEFRRENLGIVFQSLFLIPTLTVAENVALPLLISGETLEKVYPKTIEILKTVNMAHRADSKPTQLSKGQQQRVAIARAMINNSKIIVCDEPTSALDHIAGRDVVTLLHEISTQTSRAVLVVTHDHRIFSLADRIIYIEDGQIIPGGESG